MANRPSYWPAVILIVVIVAVAGGVGVVLDHYLFAPPARGSVLSIRAGDNATVNYIGVFTSGPQAGRTFDTNRYAISIDNVSWPKSLEFTPHGNQSAYTQLGVYVGASTPSGGYVVGNRTFGSVIPGFWQGMIGMTGNTTRLINISVANAYGPANPACFSPQPLVFTTPIYSTVPLATFESAYPSVSPTTGTTFPDPLYSWTDLVYSANATTVALQSLPTVGQTTHPFGLPYYVSGIANGTITVRSLLATGQAGTVLGHLGGSQTICSSSSFIVSSIDWTTNTMTWNFNREIYGQSLEFWVTVVDIFPPH